MILDRVGLGYDYWNEWLRRQDQDHWWRGQYVGNIIYKDIDITKDHDRRVLENVTVSQEEKSSRSEVIFGR